MTILDDNSSGRAIAIEVMVAVPTLIAQAVKLIQVAVVLILIEILDITHVEHNEIEV